MQLNRQLPFASSEIARYKDRLDATIEKLCSDEELADTYEEYGLSQLFMGNNFGAASNLGCACVAKEGSESIDAKSDHALSLQFWVRASCRLMYTEFIILMTPVYLTSIYCYSD